MARLHSRIYLHFLGVLVVAGLVGSLVFAVGARGTFVREAAERMVRHVASLAGERFGDRAALAERLRQLHADLDIDVVVRDLDGRVVAAAGRALPPLSDRQAATVRAGTVVVDSHPTWRAAAPVRDPQTRAIVGTLEGATPRRFGGPRLLWPVLAVTAILLVVAAATRPWRAGFRAHSSASPRPRAASAKATSACALPILVRPRRAGGRGAFTRRR